jgi:hypothetical protein
LAGPELVQLTPRQAEKWIGMTPIHTPLAPLPFALTDPLHDQQHLRGARDISATNSQLERFMERIRQAPISVSDPRWGRRLGGSLGLFLLQKFS